MIKCNLSIVFSILYKHLKLMHLDTGGKEIVFRKIFSPKKINTETTYNSSIIFYSLIEFRVRGKSKSFLHNDSEYGSSKNSNGFG